MLPSDIPTILGVRKEGEMDHGTGSSHMWPARTTKAYLSVSGRFIEQSWQMQACAPPLLWLNCTQQKVYLMTGAQWPRWNGAGTPLETCFLMLFTYQEPAGEDFYSLPPQQQSVSTWINTFRGELRENGGWNSASSARNTFSWSSESLNSQLKRFQLGNMEQLWEPFLWWRLPKEVTVAVTCSLRLMAKGACETFLFWSWGKKEKKKRCHWCESSCDRQLRLKQPFASEQLHWWHNGRLQIKQTGWRLRSCRSRRRVSKEQGTS